MIAETVSLTWNIIDSNDKSNKTYPKNENDYLICDEFGDYHKAHYDNYWDEDDNFEHGRFWDCNSGTNTYNVFAWAEVKMPDMELGK